MQEPKASALRNRDRALRDRALRNRACALKHLQLAKCDINITYTTRILYLASWGVTTEDAKLQYCKAPTDTGNFPW